MGRVGVKLEIGSAPLGLCDDGLGFRPDAWDCVFSASGPSPLRVPQVGSSALLSRGGGLPEATSSGFLNISLPKGMIMAGFVNLPSKYFSPQAHNFSIKSGPQMESEGSCVEERIGGGGGCNDPVSSGSAGSA